MQEDRQKLNAILQAYENGDAPRQPIMPNKELQQSDPLGYLEQMEQYRQDVEAFSKFKAEAEEQAKANERIMYEQDQRYAAEQAEILKKEMPELNDPEKVKTFRRYSNCGC